MSIPNERYKKILQLLDEQEFVSTNQLINELDTSRETVRRDINTLATKGKLLKVHGGASSRQTLENWEHTSIAIRNQFNVSAKRQICQKIASQIVDNDLIFIDNSTTTSFLLDYIPHNLKITIVSNSLTVINKFTSLNVSNWEIYLLGGEYDRKTNSLKGYITNNNLENINPTKGFFSAHGISHDFFVSDTRFSDIELKQIALKKAQKTFLLVDEFKFNKKGNLDICKVEDFDVVITDLKVDNPLVTQIAQKTQIISGD